MILAVALGILPFVLFAVFVLVHVLLCRVLRPASYFPGLAIQFVFFLSFLVIVVDRFCTSIEPRVLEETLRSGMILFLGGFILLSLLLLPYLTAYSVLWGSVSARVLMDMNDEPFGLSHPEKEILKKYGPGAATLRRLERMVRVGLLSKVGIGEYTLTRKGLKAAARIRFLKRLYRTGVGG